MAEICKTKNSNNTRGPRALAVFFDINQAFDKI